MWRGDAQALQATITERCCAVLSGAVYASPFYLLACWLVLIRFFRFYFLSLNFRLSVDKRTYNSHIVFYDVPAYNSTEHWTRWTLCSRNMFQCSNIKILSISPAEPLWDGIPCIYFHHPTERRKVYAVLKAVLSNLISNTQTPKQCYFRFPCKRPFDILIDWPVSSFSVSFSFSFFFHLLASFFFFFFLFFLQQILC